MPQAGYLSSLPLLRSGPVRAALHPLGWPHSDLPLHGPCGARPSDRSGTARHRLRTALSRIAAALHARTEGCGVRATARLLATTPKSVLRWEERAAQAIHRRDAGVTAEACTGIIECDEVYTRVHHHRPPDQRPGWLREGLDRVSASGGSLLPACVTTTSSRSGPNGWRPEPPRGPSSPTASDATATPAGRCYGRVFEPDAGASPGGGRKGGRWWRRVGRQPPTGARAASSSLRTPWPAASHHRRAAGRRSPC
jgi:hypothetical protein